jgi:cysteine desulfurase/selenocysteine lyase
MEVDVRKLDVDFIAFSGHKMVGPSGTGVLYGKEKLLEEMDQYVVGGDTVIETTHDSYTVEELPRKYEGGLQDYAGQMGLGEAARYLMKIGMSKIAKHEVKLNKIITDELLGHEKIKLIGPEDPQLRSGIFSFNIDGMDPHHVSKMLDASKSIMTRSGAHCVHSWFNKRNMQGSARASIYLYNTEEEVQLFVDEIKKLVKF